MKSRFLQPFFAGLCTGLLLLSSTAQAVEPAQQAIENFLNIIRNMEFPVTDQATHDELAAKANAFLDLEAMGKRALGTHYEEADIKQQQEFMDLLWKLIEYVAYPRSNKFMGKFEITYPEVKKVENGYEVHSIIKQQEEALNAKVVYHAYEIQGQWKVDDIILDDVSIAEDLKYQFDRIIGDSKFEGLLGKMRERLTKAEKENKPSAA